jgi:hypothetical protein
MRGGPFLSTAFDIDRAGESHAYEAVNNCNVAHRDQCAATKPPTWRGGVVSSTLRLPGEDLDITVSHFMTSLADLEHLEGWS